MSWTARRPSTNARIAGDRPSYAAYMLAKHVSPPTSGSCTARRIERHRRVGEERVVAVPLVGALALRVHLVEHDDLGRVLVHGLQRRHVHRPEAQRERELLLVGDVLVAEEEHEVVEQRLAEHLRRRRRSSCSRRSTPLTSAPIAAVSGVISMRRHACPPGARLCRAAINRLVPKNLRPIRPLCDRRGVVPMAGDSPRFRHLDDLPWEEVRRQQLGDHTASVREKWLDFSRPLPLAATRSETPG